MLNSDISSDNFLMFHNFFNKNDIYFLYLIIDQEFKYGIKRASKGTQCKMYQLSSYKSQIERGREKTPKTYLRKTIPS